MLANSTSLERFARRRLYIDPFGLQALYNDPDAVVLRVLQSVFFNVCFCIQLHYAALDLVMGINNLQSVVLYLYCIVLYREFGSEWSCFAFEL